MNFKDKSGTCSFLLPIIDLNSSQYGKYNSIILSIRHKIEMELGLAAPNQLAQIYFGSSNAALLLTETSGTQNEQQLTISIDKQNLPDSVNKIAHFMFQSSSLVNKGTAGWQISSIAVNGNQ